MQRRLDPARLGDHLDRLYRAAWALSGRPEDAEDLVQETYAREHARIRLLHEVLRVLAPAAQRPGGPVEPVEVVSEPGWIERVLHRVRT